jgi:hypothetical protein
MNITMANSSDAFSSILDKLPISCLCWGSENTTDKIKMLKKHYCYCYKNQKVQKTSKAMIMNLKDMIFISTKKN